jgi:gluconate 5-dehydrogenase
MAANDLFRLSGKRALITGSSQGIGLSLARALATAGAEVVMNARHAAALERAAAELRAGGASVHAVAFDVTDPAAVRTGIESIETGIGPLDILVNNAGTNRRAPLQDFSVEAWRDILRVNVDSVFLVAQAVAGHMIRRKSGKIVNVCSVLAERARPGTAPYAASKGAVKMLTKGMCADWARYGIQVNALGPGYIRTELTGPLFEDPVFSKWLRDNTPSERNGELHDLDGAVVFLCSSAADFVNGQVLYVDGGMTAVL